MSTTLNENLNVIAENENIEITLLDGDISFISKLDDEPNDVGGMTSAQLKAEFDKAGNVIKDYINNSLIPEILAASAVEATRAANEAQREANEEARISEERDRIASEEIRKANEDVRISAEELRIQAENNRQAVSSEVLTRAEKAAKDAEDSAVRAENAVIDTAKKNLSNVSNEDMLAKMQEVGYSGDGSVPTHASQHASDGSDPITPEMIGAVNKAGDTMTNSLTIEKDGSSYFTNINLKSGRECYIGASDDGTYIIANRIIADSNNRVTLWLGPNDKSVADLFRINNRVDGVAATYQVLHTGNKPSGSYTGNGSATQRVVKTDGIGNVILIWSTNGFALVSASGAIVGKGTAVSAISGANVSFGGGNIVISSADTALNANGVTYSYQVL